MQVEFAYVLECFPTDSKHICIFMRNIFLGKTNKYTIREYLLGPYDITHMRNYNMINPFQIIFICFRP